MKAGSLRHYGNIVKRQDNLKGDRGQTVIVPTVIYADVPFGVEPLHGRTLEIARQFSATASHKLTLRWEDGITAGMQVIIESRTFNIEFVDEGDFKKHDLYLICTEQTTGAV